MDNAKIVNIQHFCTDDGPGVRTTVFFKGCNLRCEWCHNPESQSAENDLFFYPRKCIGCLACQRACPVQADTEKERNAAGSAPVAALFTERCRRCGACANACNAEALELSGREISCDEMFSELCADADMYAMSGGGVTFSGGEPILQRAFLARLLPRLKTASIRTAIETAGCYPFPWVAPLLPYIDLVYCDLKTPDDGKHRRYTGVSNADVLQNLKLFSEHANKLVIRTPVIVGFNDGDIEAIGSFAAALPRPAEVELLPYHDMCRTKYRAMNRPFHCEGFSTPTEEQMRHFKKQLSSVCRR